MKETNGGSFLRNASNFNIRHQDGSKQYLFCQNCESRLNIGETYFSKNIFYPYVNKKKFVFEYNRALYYFLISMLWRVLLLNVKLLRKSEIPHKELFSKAMNDWQRYLLGDLDFTEFNNIHLIFTDVTISDNLPTVFYNRYLTRATDGALLYTSKNAIVYSKFSKFMIFGKLLDNHNGVWKNTNVINGEGILTSHQTVDEPQIFEFIIERASEINNMLQNDISINQKKIIRSWGFDNLEKFTNSELFQVIDADYTSNLASGVFSNVKIGRNDFCPCNSGKKYKHCHGK